MKNYRKAVLFWVGALLLAVAGFGGKREPFGRGRNMKSVSRKPTVFEIVYIALLAAFVWYYASGEYLEVSKKPAGGLDGAFAQVAAVVPGDMSASFILQCGDVPNDHYLYDYVIPVIEVSKNGRWRTIPAKAAVLIDLPEFDPYAFPLMSGDTYTRTFKWGPNTIYDWSFSSGEYRYLFRVLELLPDGETEMHYIPVSFVIP